MPIKRYKMRKKSRPIRLVTNPIPLENILAAYEEIQRKKRKEGKK
jgi:hypothetical protein